MLTGYLNEVINHKRLAIEAIKQIAGDDTDRFRRYASLFELHNINVFLGGFAGALEVGEVGTFDDYLAKVAPFSTEAELRKYLEMRGVVVEEHVLKDWGIAGEIKAALKGRGKYREDIVVAHDAAQLEVFVPLRRRKPDRFLLPQIARSCARRERRVSTTLSPISFSRSRWHFWRAWPIARPPDFRRSPGRCGRSAARGRQDTPILFRPGSPRVRSGACRGA